MRAHIIKEIQRYFKNNWTETDISYSADSSNDFKDEYISMKFIPSTINRKYLGDAIHGKAVEGYVRFFLYSENQTRGMELLDLMYNFLDNKEVEKIRLFELNIVSSPSKMENSEMFCSVVDYSFCFML